MKRTIKFFLLFLLLCVYFAPSVKAVSANVKAEKPLVTIACLSDLHNQQSLISGDVLSVQLRGTVTNTLNAIKAAENIDLMIFNGDYTSDVTIPQNNWEKVRELMINASRATFPTGAASTPVLYVLGNHDYEVANFDNLPKPYNAGDFYNTPMKTDIGELAANDAFYEQSLDGARSLLAAYHYNIKGLDFVVLNAGKYFYTGAWDYQYSQEAVQWVADKLAALYAGKPDKTVFFLAHLPFADSKGISNANKGLKDCSATTLLKTSLAKYPKLVYLYGHDHGTDAAYIRTATSQRVTQYASDGSVYTDGGVAPTVSDFYITNSVSGKYLGMGVDNMSEVSAQKKCNVVASVNAGYYNIKIQDGTTAAPTQVNVYCGSNGRFSSNTATTDMRLFKVTSKAGATATATQVTAAVDAGAEYLIVGKISGTGADYALTNEPYSSGTSFRLVGTPVTISGNTITYTDGNTTDTYSALWQFAFAGSTGGGATTKSFLSSFVGSMRYYSNSIDGSVGAANSRIVQAMIVYVYPDRVELQMKNYGESGTISGITIAENLTPYVDYRAIDLDTPPAATYSVNFNAPSKGTLLVETVDGEGQATTIATGAVLSEGAKVRFTCTPEASFVVGNFVVNGENKKADLSAGVYEVTLAKDMTVAANFMAANNTPRAWLNFGGTATKQYVSIPHSDDFLVTSDKNFTISCWFYYDYTLAANLDARLFSKREMNYATPGLSNKSGIELFCGGNSTQFLGLNTPNNPTTGNPVQALSVYATETGANTGKWYHVAVTIDRATSKAMYYLNGVKKAENTDVTKVSGWELTNTYDLLLGAARNTGAITYFLRGRLANVRLYNTALSLNGVGIDMTTPELADYSNVIAAYDFKNFNGKDVIDISGKGHNGTAYNMGYIVTYPTGVDNGTIAVKDAAGNAVAVGGSVLKGSSITIDATPTTGYTLDKIFVNGAAIVGNTYIVNAEITAISATFTAGENVPVADFSLSKTTVTTPGGGLESELIDIAFTGTSAEGTPSAAITVNAIGTNNQQFRINAGVVGGVTNWSSFPASHKTFTIQSWVYPTDLSKVGGSLLFWAQNWSYAPSNANNCDGMLMLRRTSGGFNVQSRFNGTGDCAINSSEIPLNAWSHVALVVDLVDSKTIKLYVNGVLKGTRTGVDANTGGWGNDFTMMGVGENGYGGKIANFAVWDKAVSQVELVSSMSGYTALETIPAGMVAYVDFVTKSSTGTFVNRGSASTSNGTYIRQAGSAGNNTPTLIDPTIASEGGPLLGSDRLTWSFGPGSVLKNSDLRNPQIAYTTVGEKTIELTVSGVNGLSTKRKVVTVEDAPVPCEITIAVNDATLGTISIDPSTSPVMSGTSVTATAVAGKGNAFINWTNGVGGAELSKNAVYTFIAATSVDLVANFETKRYPTDMVTQFGAATAAARQKQWIQRYVANAKTVVSGVDQAIITNQTVNPTPAYNGTSSAYMPGALVDMTATKIQIPLGTASFTFYAEGVKSGSNGDGLEWTNQWVFVDWNQDKNYVALTPSATTTGQDLRMRDGFTRTITIPAGTTAGVYRMYIVYNEQPSSALASFFTDLDAGRPKIQSGIGYAFDIEVFTLDPQTLTYNGTATEGTFTIKEGEVVVNSGAEVVPFTRLTVDAVPAEGYKVSAIKVNGTAISGNTFSMPSIATTVTVEYVAVFPLTFTFSPEALGTMTVKQGLTPVSSGDEFEADTQLTVTVDLTNPNATLKSVVFNGTTLANLSTFTITITQASNLEVVAEVPTYTLTYSVSGGGTKRITYVDDEETPLNSGDVINKGQELHIVYTPNEGETLVSSMLNGTIDILDEEFGYYYEGEAWLAIDGNMDIATTFTGTGINQANADGIVIYAADGVIYATADFTVYNLSSQVVATGLSGEGVSGLPQGTYIVKAATAIAKVSL